MRIHTNALHLADIAHAAKLAGVTYDATQKGSRSRDHAFDVTLFGSGRTGGRWGNTGTRGASSEKSATWDEWGIFLNALFEADESVRVAKVYEDRESFDWATGSRYRDLAAEDAHHNHRWEHSGYVVTGSYSVSECTGCHAVRRWRTSQDFQGMAPGGDLENAIRNGGAQR